MIPPKLRREMADDPYYSRCALTGATSGVEWHHNLRFAGKNVQERFCIIPLSRDVHARIDHHKERVDWIMLNRMTDAELTRYSKAVDFHAWRLRLNEKYGSI